MRRIILAAAVAGCALSIARAPAALAITTEDDTTSDSGTAAGTSDTSNSTAHDSMIVG